MAFVNNKNNWSKNNADILFVDNVKKTKHKIVVNCISTKKDLNYMGSNNFNKYKLN